MSQENMIVLDLVLRGDNRVRTKLERDTSILTDLLEAFAAQGDSQRAVFGLPTLDRQGTIFVRVNDIMSIEVDRPVLPSTAISPKRQQRSAVVIQDFLQAETNVALLQYIESREQAFKSSTITENTSGFNVVDKKQRISSVLIDKGYPLSMFTDVVMRAFPTLLNDLGLETFEVGSVEVQVTAHGDGAFFGRHRDDGGPANAGRFVTFVYYLHEQPQPFSGGLLSIYGEDGRCTLVEPVNNSIVFFQSRLEHQVGLVQCSDDRFRNSRFTINGWVHKAEPKQARAPLP